MESGTEGLFDLGGEAQIGTHPEVEDIYERIEALPNNRKGRLVRKLIETLTTDELATVLDEIAIRLHETQ